MAKQLLVCQGVLIAEASLSHSGNYTQSVSSGRVISSKQKPIPDNTQQSKETDIRAPSKFEPAFPASKRPQTHVLDRLATAIDCYSTQALRN